MPKDDSPTLFRHIGVKDGQDILEETGEGVGLAGVRTGREPVPEHVRGNAGEPESGEMVELVRPDVRAAADSVQEEQEWKAVVVIWRALFRC